MKKRKINHTGTLDQVFRLVSDINYSSSSKTTINLNPCFIILPQYIILKVIYFPNFRFSRDHHAQWRQTVPGSRRQQGRYSDHQVPTTRGRVAQVGCCLQQRTY